jgi:diacylglycerol kinase (ATP)
VLDESPFKGKTGLQRVWNALHYSLAGLRAAYLAEDAFRQEVLLAALLIPLACFVAPDGVGRALMVGSVLLVLIVELLNSAIEATVDRISFDRHPPGQARQGYWQCSGPAGLAQCPRRLGLRAARLSARQGLLLPGKAPARHSM